MSSLEIGWSQSQARSALESFRRLFALNLVLQSLMALICMLFPATGAKIAGLSPAQAMPFLPIWGGMVLVISALQVFAWLDPIRQRFQVAIAILGRVLMVVVYLCLGAAFWRFALFDAVFAVLLGLFLHRALIAELQTRP